MYGRTKIFNFYRLSDSKFNIITGRLSSDNILGLEDVTVSINVSAVAASQNPTTATDYAIGGRMYIEISIFDSNTKSLLLETPYLSFFFDLSGEFDGGYQEIPIKLTLTIVISVLVSWYPLNEYHGL